MVSDTAAPFLFHRSNSNNPYYNLALEEYLFNNYAQYCKIFMLWQNANSIIIGKNQNTAAEINQLFVEENNITVARRLSGGGAVYHDLGNLNFTFVVPSKSSSFDFSLFTQPIIETLMLFNIEAQASSRNDITIAGRKFSGNAQYHQKGLIMHHGTILFDSDLSVLQNALKVRKNKIKAKGVTSTISQVTNLKEYLDESVSLADFETALMHCVLGENYQTYIVDLTAQQKISELQKKKYATWQWNYGNSPQCQMIKEVYVPNCGHIELHLSLNNGFIEEIYSYGDYFGNEDFSIIQKALLHCPYNKTALEAALVKIAVNEVFNNLNNSSLVEILLTN